MRATQVHDALKQSGQQSLRTAHQILHMDPQIYYGAVSLRAACEAHLVSG